MKIRTSLPISVVHPIGATMTRRHTSVITVTLLFLASTAAAQGQINILVTSSFNSNDGGWQVLETNQGLLPVQWVSAGGVPKGHIEYSDVYSGSQSFVAPPAFLGNFKELKAGGVSFDWRSNDIDPETVFNRRVSINIYNGSTRLGVSSPVTPTNNGNWLNFSYLFNPSAGWIFDDGTPSPKPATQDQIDVVLNNITDLRITAESRVGWSETVKLDNPTIFAKTKAIPTVSEWGLVAMSLSLLVGARIYFGRRRDIFKCCG